MSRRRDWIPRANHMVLLISCRSCGEDITCVADSVTAREQLCNRCAIYGNRR